MRRKFWLWMGIFALIAAAALAVWATMPGARRAPVPRPAEPTVAPGASYTYTLRVGKLDRSYRVYVPAAYQLGRAAAVVVAYHGEGSTAAAFGDQTGLTKAADKYGCIVVFPEGWRPAPAKPADSGANAQTWNDGSGLTLAGTSAVDDVSFSKAILTDLAARYTIDPKRTYAVGYATGASLVLRLAVEQAQLFTAVAAVSANGLTTAATRPSRPVPVMLIQGGVDPVRSKTFAGQLMRRLVTLDGCQAVTNTRTVVPGVTAATYPMCPPGMTASYVYVSDMGHVWPGGTGSAPELTTGPNSSLINGSEIIWQFLASQKH